MWLALAFTCSALAADDLAPTEGVFSWVEDPDPYHVAVREKLLEHRYRQCQLIVLPSFKPEWTVYVVRDGDSAQLFYNVMPTPLWGEMMRQIRSDAGGSSYSIGPAAQRAALAKLTIQTRRRAVVIENATANALMMVWDRMLSRTRYPDTSNFGLDGTTYVAAQWRQGTGYRSGTTWSPEPATFTGDLVEIAEKMRALAEADGPQRPAIERELIAMSNALLSKLAARKD